MALSVIGSISKGVRVEGREEGIWHLVSFHMEWECVQGGKEGGREGGRERCTFVGFLTKLTTHPHT